MEILVPRNLKIDIDMSLIALYQYMTTPTLIEWSKTTGFQVDTEHTLMMYLSSRKTNI